MKKSTRILCLMLSLIFILSVPFLVSSGAMVGDVAQQLKEEEWNKDSDESEEEPEAHINQTLSGRNLWTMLGLSAQAEEAAATPQVVGATPAPTADNADSTDDKALAVDFNPGPAPNPAAFTDNGYKDRSIEVNAEIKEENGVIWRVMKISLKDPSQLRTATAGKPGSKSVAMISSMAGKYNAVVALNANYMANEPTKTSFEYRMGQKIRTKYNRSKDLLIIDENADFHVFIKSSKKEVDAFLAQGHTIVNAMTFGPALVKDGALVEVDRKYGYNPHGREPRMAIGQTGPLNYVIVHAEGRSDASKGATHEELANFMYAIGCQQAFNLDGGNSATLLLGTNFYQNRTGNNERAQSDMIYFATLVPESAWR